MPAVEKGIREVRTKGRDRRIPGAGRARDRLLRQVPPRISPCNRGQSSLLGGDPRGRAGGVHIRDTAPASAEGAITGDLTSQRGVVGGTDSDRLGQLTELANYQSPLNAMPTG